MSSDEIRYSPDSEKFPVTANPSSDHFNSLWLVKKGNENDFANYDEFLKCDDVIVLEHVLTNKNLHMDFTSSMIGGNLNVTNNNKNDNINEENYFLISCVNQTVDTIVQGSTEFHLKNLKTKGFVYTNNRNDYNHQNCGRRCPILGHHEVSGLKFESYDTKWKIHSGIFFNNEINEKKANEKWVFEAEDVFDKVDEL